MSRVCARDRDPAITTVLRVGVRPSSGPGPGVFQQRGLQAASPIEWPLLKYWTMNDIKKLSCLLMCRRPVDIILQIQIALMTSKTKMILSGAFATLTGLVALDAVYLLGYQHGS